ncbi:MAG: DUF177 domain-containing protein [Phaeodactylibacter sp.]|nr:DUF177 domain-containing protein [Phaeodactylibacter sp.]
MSALNQYAIPVLGLREGMHRFEYEIGADFFAEFEDSVIKDGELHVTLDFDKRSNLIVMTFQIEGHIQAECDRCLESFDAPLTTRQTLTVKYAEEEREEAEVLYIQRGTPSLDVAKFIYEFIHLAMPMILTHEQAGQECDEEMLRYLDTPAEDEAEPNPVWQALRDLGDQ